MAKRLTTVYDQVKEFLASAGTYSGSSPAKTVNELAAKFSVTGHPIRKALETLEDEGWIIVERTPGQKRSSIIRATWLGDPKKRQRRAPSKPSQLSDPRLEDITFGQAERGLLKLSELETLAKAYLDGDISAREFAESSLEKLTS